jgi:hypothetical protein
MVKLRLTLPFLVAAMASTGALLAQDDPAQQALKCSGAQKTNLALLKEYSWKSRVEVQAEGEKQAVILNQVRFNTKGEIERTPIGGESEVKKKHGIRGKIQKSKQEEAKEFTEGVVKLLFKYVLPSAGDLVDFFQKASFARTTAEGGSVEIQGKGMHLKDDTVTMWVDPATNLPKRLKVRTWVPKEEGEDDRIWVEAVLDYATLANGANYAERTTVNIAAKEMRLILEQFDHIKQGG